MHAERQPVVNLALFAGSLLSDVSVRASKTDHRALLVILIYLSNRYPFFIIIKGNVEP